MDTDVFGGKGLRRWKLCGTRSAIDAVLSISWLKETHSDIIEVQTA